LAGLMACSSSPMVVAATMKGSEGAQANHEQYRQPYADLG
jgi:hypothetical protein